MKTFLKILTFTFLLVAASGCVKVEYDPYAKISNWGQTSYENQSYGIVEIDYSVYNTACNKIHECSTVFALRLADGTYKYATAVDYDIDRGDYSTSIMYVDTGEKQCVGIDIISCQER